MVQIIQCGDKDAAKELPRRWLIYGPAASGKTKSLLTLPSSMRPALILDIDKGGAELDEDETLGTRILFDSHDKLGEPCGHKQLTDFLQQVHANKIKLPHECGAYKTVVCDSLTVAIQNINQATLQWYKDNGEKGNARESLDQPPTQAEYGMIAHMAKKLVMGLIQLNRNLIVICHEADTVKDETTGATHTGPALQKSLAIDLPRYFDELLYSKVKGRGTETKFVWYTRPSGMFIARTRIKSISAEIPQDFSVYDVPAVTAPSTT